MFQFGGPRVPRPSQPNPLSNFGGQGVFGISQASHGFTFAVKESLARLIVVWVSPLVVRESLTLLSLFWILIFNGQGVLDCAQSSALFNFGGHGVPNLAQSNLSLLLLSQGVPYVLTSHLAFVYMGWEVLDISHLGSGFSYGVEGFHDIV